MHQSLHSSALSGCVTSPVVPACNVENQAGLWVAQAVASAGQSEVSQQLVAAV